jgi:two-component system chemotaxis sensor kinase CheA
MPGSLSSIAAHQQVYHLRDEYIPILQLHEVFNVKPKAQEITDGLLMIVEDEGRKIGLFVDELLAQQQIVIKSLQNNFRRIEGISGATILGDGTVALIVDIGGLIKLSQVKKRDAPARLPSRLVA